MSNDTSDIVDRVTRGWAEGAPDVLLGIACKEIEELRKQLAEARGLYLQRNYRGEQLERELAAMRQQRNEAVQVLKNIALQDYRGHPSAEREQIAMNALAAIKQRDDARGQTWYLLYGGTSEDGMGTGHYIGRTTDKEVARKHHAELRKSPYSIGFVEIVTDTEKKRVSYYGRELETKKEESGA